MSMSQEQINAMIAAAKAKAEEAKARALANAAILQQRAQQQQQQQQAAQPPPTAASVSGGAGAAAGGLSQLELIRQRKEALQAKLSRVIPAASAGPTAASSSGSRPAGAGVGMGGTAAASGQRTTTVKGGLGMDMAPMISRDAEGNLIINSVTAGKSVKTPSFATAKVNQKPEPKKELKILSVPEEFTNPEKNPYFDENLAAAPRERRSRPLKFAQQGKYINIANQIRSDQRAEQMRREIEEAAKANVEEDDQQIKDGFTKREVLKGVEWWDAGFLPNKTYDDIKDGNARIETEDDPLITHYIQHPVPIEPPNEAAHAASAKPRPLMLTTKERKRLRRQRRAELLKEKQDKIRLGLLPADAPKVKLANMMRVLGQEAVLNPTEIEMKVRQQVADRLQGHLDHNAAAKLTHEQRKAKESKKKEEDVAKGIYVSLYKINDLSHPQKKFKVDKNATQLGLTGIVLMYPTFSIVLVEGGHKAINQYKKLMLRRIDWSDNTRLDGTEVSETTIDNKCLLVWEGQLRERQFKTFRFLKATNDAQLKQVLTRHGVQHYWDQALGFKEEDMLGAEVTL
ncbi:pre-mRNA processing factor 3-domain-containing protein [Linnemannia elongata]|nr:pre-mRNA processing factor 3-domain-containing protein [Linnemannia elongata]